MGETTAAIAAAHPENDYLGIEVHTPGVGSLLKLIDASNLSNVRIIQHDAVEVLRDMIAPASLDGTHIFFPDPWPKKRHHKRRLVQADFVALLASRLKPGGYLHLATDWQEYAEQMLAVLGAEPQLENTAAGLRRSQDRLCAATGVSPANQVRNAGFEAGARRLGHRVSQASAMSPAFVPSPPTPLPRAPQGYFLRGAGEGSFVALCA